MAIPAIFAGTASNADERRARLRLASVLRDAATLALLILFALFPLLVRFWLRR
jgi:hypothetical protein